MYSENDRLGAFDVHLGILLCVHHSSNGNTEVGDRAPEVCGVDLLDICPASMTPIDIQSGMNPLNALPSVRYRFLGFSLLAFAKAQAIAIGRSRGREARESRGGPQYVRVEQT